MTLRARIIAACAAALAIATGLWLYAEWPRWFGREIVVAVNISNRQGPNGQAILSYEDSRLHLADVPVRGNPAVPRIEVRQIGSLPGATAEPGAAQPELRNATVYLQMVISDGAASDSAPRWHPVSISAVPQENALNLRATIRSADNAGQLDVAFAPALAPVAIQQMAHPRMSAILKVLPSGRAALVGVIDGNQRRQFN